MPYKLNILLNRVNILIAFVTLSAMGFAQHTNTDLGVRHREAAILNTKEQETKDKQQKNAVDKTIKNNPSTPDNTNAVKKEVANNNTSQKTVGVSPTSPAYIPPPLTKADSIRMEETRRIKEKNNSSIKE